MKIKFSAQGTLILLGILLGIPVCVDLIILSFIPRAKELRINMTGFVTFAYLKFLPWYIMYVLVVLSIPHLWKSWKKRNHY